MILDLNNIACNIIVPIYSNFHTEIPCYENLQFVSPLIDGTIRRPDFLQDDGNTNPGTLDLMMNHMKHYDMVAVHIKHPWTDILDSEVQKDSFYRFVTRASYMTSTTNIYYHSGYQGAFAYTLNEPCTLNKNKQSGFIKMIKIHFLCYIQSHISVVISYF